MEKKIFGIAMVILRAPEKVPSHTLVHICCAPDATYGILKISENFGNVTGFFHNPNIWPFREYRKRLKETEKLSAIYAFDFIEGIRNSHGWYSAIRGREEDPERELRCRICIGLRIEESAIMAKKLGIDTFTTVLSVSPKKDVDMINETGRQIGAKHGLFFIELDLKKKEGFKQSVALSKKFKIYRQNYCGCEFSVRK